MVHDEFSFITSITPNSKSQSTLSIGIGDDAALYQSNEHTEQVVCLDTMVEGIHFREDTMDPYHIGYKALAANISDLAAMGAIPRFYLVSICIPSSWEEPQLLDIYRGMEKLAKEFHMDLIGGDTVSTKGPLVLSITVIGEVEKGRHLLRSNAEQGDIVFVTGTIGAAAAGLDLLFQVSKEASFNPMQKEMIRAHQLPYPQVLAGRLLALTPFRISLNDVSDGLASEANEIAEASNVSIVLEEEQLPYNAALTEYPIEERRNYALFGGEDYQLVGTVGASNWNNIKELFAQNGLAITNVGIVEKGPAKVELKTKGAKRLFLEKRGFNHFKQE